MPENKNDTENLGELLKIRRDKLTALQEAGQDPFQITKFEKKNNTQEIRENFEALEEQPVKIAGRLMSKRVMGKVTFCDLQDREGRVQLYVRRDEVGEEPYKTFKKYDIGDIVGVDGVVFRTQRGEISVRAKEVTLLSKSLLPLPEKFHGLTNQELRYRQRISAAAATKWRSSMETALRWGGSSLLRRLRRSRRHPCPLTCATP